MPELRLGTQADPDDLAAVEIVGWDGLRVRLGKKLERTGCQLESASNDNRQFLVRIQLKKPPREFVPYLGVGGRWWEGGSGGSEDGGIEALFEVDRDAALRLATAWSIKLRERAPLDGLRSVWSFPEDSGPLEVRLELESGSTLGLGHSGFYSFEFEASREGRPVPGKGPFMFSGPMAFSTIRPGAPLRLTADLRGWFDFEVACRHELTAHFGGTLSRSREALGGGLAWDFRTTGQGWVLVRR